MLFFSRNISRRGTGELLSFVGLGISPRRAAVPSKALETAPLCGDFSALTVVKEYCNNKLVFLASGLRPVCNHNMRSF